MGKLISANVAAPAGALVVGLILAFYQVQGWIMPTPLAVFILVILFGLLAFFIGAIFIVVIKAVKQIKESQSISASWVSSESPGLLDCKADGERAQHRLSKELERLRKDINGLNRQARQHERAVNGLLTSNKQTNAKTQQQKANRIGNKLSRRAVYIEKRVELFNTLTKEIVRNYEVMAATWDMSDPKDRLSAENLISAFELFGRAGESMNNALVNYKKFAGLYAQANLTKIIREGSNRLAASLDALTNCFTEFHDNCLHLTLHLRSKRTNVDSSIPDKEGSQSR